MIVSSTKGNCVIPRPSRRAFVSGVTALAVGSAIAVMPEGARAEQATAPRRIGILLVNFSPEGKEAQAFRHGLRDAGYAEGRDVTIEWRSARGDYGRVPALVAEMVQIKLDVIVVDTTLASQAVKRATSTIPIVMALVADPVASGLVENLAHPGGNVTGVSNMTSELSAKRLQLLKEAIPRVARVTVLWNPDTPFHNDVIEELKAAASPLAIDLNFAGARTPEDIGSAFSAVNRTHAQALYVVGAPLFNTNRATLLKLASRAKLPAMYTLRQYVDEGGLMSYGPDLGDIFRRSAGYVDKILKGAKPGDLPIEQPTKFELVVNLKTAKALGITIPEAVLLGADEVIQ
ncbi:MAG TPA: ABC transporter substrate-binding protein [Steroidobacteraceae bacterium]|jgi:putative ABC transport system substrate-binding protein|nr:ABC transporter substrate-binding protein [Steroidobacteraceae bacterium]